MKVNLELVVCIKLNVEPAPSKSYASISILSPASEIYCHFSVTLICIYLSFWPGSGIDILFSGSTQVFTDSQSRQDIFPS